MSIEKKPQQVFVAGEWSAEKAEPFAQQGREVGILLAQSGFVLTCGPGSGLARYVLEGYDSVRKLNPGLPKPIFYLPKLSEMARVGEKEESYGIDIAIIHTDLDYPGRNVIQVKASDAVIAITGGRGTLTEISHAIDFNLPVAILDNSGPMVDAAKALPSIREAVFFGNSAQELVTYIKQKLDSKEDGDDPAGKNIFIST